MHLLCNSNYYAHYVHMHTTSIDLYKLIVWFISTCVNKWLFIIGSKQRVIAHKAFFYDDNHNLDKNNYVYDQYHTAGNWYGTKSVCLFTKKALMNCFTYVWNYSCTKGWYVCTIVPTINLIFCYLIVAYMLELEHLVL